MYVCCKNCCKFVAQKANPMQQKTNITLRQRTLPSGKKTLYLDITSGGKRRTESLNLFLLPDTSRETKQKNRETLKFAETILAKRIVESKNSQFGFNNNPRKNVLFLDYFRRLSEKADFSEKTQYSYDTVIKLIQKYDDKANERTFTEIDTQWIRGFIDYLKKTKSRRNGSFSENSIGLYFAKLKACINRAIRDKIIVENPTLGVDPPRHKQSERMYLTIDELRRLSATPCRDEEIKRAFLFSCLTGLRFSDIHKMTWAEVTTQSDLTRIIFRQRKTSWQEYLDITPQAAQLLGQRKNDHENVFTQSPLITINTNLSKWCRQAGINKHISFHCARHTFAVMMLDIGTDLYTVSKLLGHANISTTQIYAKILDKNKQEAVRRIPSIL